MEAIARATEDINKDHLNKACSSFQSRTELCAVPSDALCTLVQPDKMEDKEHVSLRLTMPLSLRKTKTKAQHAE
ncbi:hypothetical protein ACTXT7_013696 [Hymenolepis weldensis]